MIWPINSCFFWMGAGRWQGLLARMGMTWALPPDLLVHCLRSGHRERISSLTPGMCVRQPACVPHTAVVLLSLLSLGKNVQHSSYSKQHPWCLISWVHFTPQWSLAVNFHTSAVCLGSSPCFANWTESGKGSLPCTHGKGPHLSSLCQPAGRLAEALAGPEGECPPSVSFSLPVSKMSKQRFNAQPLDKLGSRIYEERWWDWVSSE